MLAIIRRLICGVVIVCTVAAAAAPRANGQSSEISGVVVSRGQQTIPLVFYEARRITLIAAGAYHSLALKSDGTVVAWGFNATGQSDVPANLRNVIQMAAGGYHSLALRSDGTAIGWGDNDIG